MSEFIKDKNFYGTSEDAAYDFAVCTFICVYPTLNRRPLLKSGTVNGSISERTENFHTNHDHWKPCDEFDGAIVLDGEPCLEEERPKKPDYLPQDVFCSVDRICRSKVGSGVEL